MDPLTMMAAVKTGSTIFGAMQAAKGKMKMNQADKMAPNEADPNRLAALEDAKRRTKQAESGTDTTTQQAVKSADQSTVATQKQLAGVTGGAVGGTVSAMLQALKSGGNIKNDAYTKAGERALANLGVANRIGEKISQRALDIKQFKSVQRRAEGANALKTGMGNLSAGLFGSLPTDADGKTAGSPGAISAILQKYGGGATTGGETTPTTPTAATPPVQSVLPQGFGGSNVSSQGSSDPTSPFFGVTGNQFLPASSLTSYLK